MKIFPAIDIKEGKCVRLKRGNKEEKKIYSANPLDQALVFQRAGLENLHLINLDGAFSEKSDNEKIIEDISRNTQLKIQLGGGIRSISQMEKYFDMGIKRLILGTKAIEDQAFLDEALKKFGSEKVAVSLDCQGQDIKTRGWQKNSGLKLFTLAEDLEKLGLKYLIYTDITKDGMLTSPNFKTLKALNEGFSMKIIASGGVSSRKDLEKLKDLGLYGSIVGKAYYENRLTLEEMLEMEENDG